jgi:hypothetical protein
MKVIQRFIELTVAVVVISGPASAAETCDQLNSRASRDHNTGGLTLEEFQSMTASIPADAPLASLSERYATLLKANGRVDELEHSSADILKAAQQKNQTRIAQITSTLKREAAEELQAEGKLEQLEIPEYRKFDWDRADYDATCAQLDPEATTDETWLVHGSGRVVDWMKQGQFVSYPRVGFAAGSVQHYGNPERKSLPRGSDADLKSIRDEIDQCTEAKMNAALAPYEKQIAAMPHDTHNPFVERADLWLKEARALNSLRECLYKPASSAQLHDCLAKGRNVYEAIRREDNQKAAAIAALWPAAEQAVKDKYHYAQLTTELATLEQEQTQAIKTATSLVTSQRSRRLAAFQCGQMKQSALGVKLAQGGGGGELSAAPAP